MDPVAQKEIPARIERARTELQQCRLCPRNCGVDRTAGRKGFCGLTAETRCFREVLNDYEEEEFVPSHHVCFTGCNLRCEFCTVMEWNLEPLAAKEINVDDLAAVIALRGSQGARTLNLLGGEPSVNLPGILELLARIPADTRVLWNSNMYFNPPVSELLTGLADVYLADFKCGNPRCAARLLGADDYVDIVKRNLKIVRNATDILIRHVILPGHLECCTRPILRWIAKELPEVKISLRNDYIPPPGPCRSPIQYLREEEFGAAITEAGLLNLNLVKMDETKALQTQTR